MRESGQKEVRSINIANIYRLLYWLLLAMFFLQATKRTDVFQEYYSSIYNAYIYMCVISSDVVTLLWDDNTY